jgi:hypothetical protein
MRIAMAIALIWVVLTLLPYLIIGETWGMVWFYLALPLSSLFKDLWEDLGEVPYVAIVSVYNFWLLFEVIDFLSRMGQRLFGGPTKPPDSESSGEDAGTVHA